MAGYKKVTKEDAEVFLKLYEKYLLKEDEEIREIKFKRNEIYEFKN